VNLVIFVIVVSFVPPPSAVSVKLDRRFYNNTFTPNLQLARGVRPRMTAP
jgi:hypothetical protein